MMPMLFDLSVYPGGVPIQPQNISVNNATVLDLFLKFCRDESGAADQEVLKDYTIYYLKAPCFDNPVIDILRAKNLKSMDLTDLLFECLDYGIDPF